MPRILDREARRAEIVKAAASVFAERGVANTAVGDIVKAAGVAQGTFYLYFRSKDDILPAVAESFGDYLIDRVERAVLVPGRSAIERLTALRDTLADYSAVADVRELVEVLHQEGNRAIHDRLAEHLTPRLVAVLEGIVEQGIAEGVFAVPDVHAAAWFVLGGLQSAELSGVPLDQMPAALATVTELALRALGYEGARP